MQYVTTHTCKTPFGSKYWLLISRSLDTQARRMTKGMQIVFDCLGVFFTSSFNHQHATTTTLRLAWQKSVIWKDYPFPMPEMSYNSREIKKKLPSYDEEEAPLQRTIFNILTGDGTVCMTIGGDGLNSR